MTCGWLVGDVGKLRREWRLEATLRPATPMPQPDGAVFVVHASACSVPDTLTRVFHSRTGNAWLDNHRGLSKRMMKVGGAVVTLPLPPKPDRRISRIRLSSSWLPMGWLRLRG